MAGPEDVSDPEPIWKLMATPLEPAAAAPRLGTPVMFPGFRLDSPLLPVMYRLIGIGTPLTGLADPPLGPPLPREPAADEFAPGNGVINERPLVVRMMIPKLAIAGRSRSSRTHSLKSGRKIKGLYILEIPERNLMARFPLSDARWTDRSVRSAFLNNREFALLRQVNYFAIPGVDASRVPSAGWTRWSPR